MHHQINNFKSNCIATAIYFICYSIISLAGHLTELNFFRCNLSKIDLTHNNTIDGDHHLKSTFERLHTHHFKNKMAESPSTSVCGMTDFLAPTTNKYS